MSIGLPMIDGLLCVAERHQLPVANSPTLFYSAESKVPGGYMRGTFMESECEFTVITWFGGEEHSDYCRTHVSQPYGLLLHFRLYLGCNLPSNTRPFGLKMVELSRATPKTVCRVALYPTQTTLIPYKTGPSLSYSSIYWKITSSATFRQLPWFLNSSHA